MSTDPELEQLRVVFYCFSFFLLGIVCRHCGIIYKAKASYYGVLYIVGTVLGLMSKKISHMRDPILQHCGPMCLQTFYIPLFFFETGFLLQVNSIRPKILLFTFLILLPVWVLTGAAVTLMGSFLFPYDIPWTSYMVMVILSMTPDVQAIKMFFKSRYSSIDQNLVTLLEFEGLVCACLVSVVFHSVLLHVGSESSLLSLPFELMLTFMLGVAAGDVLTFWLKTIVNDIVIQTTITTAFIFITFCTFYELGLIPGIAVLIVSIVMMRAKPSLSVKFNEFIILFIGIFRFGLISILCVVAGMELVTRIGPLVTVTAITDSLIIYVVASSIRFFTLLILWPVYRRYCFNGLHDVLMIWACNIRGPFNLVMSFTFTLNKNQMSWANDRLFLLASLQIALSFFITMPIANLVLTALRKRTLDYEKLAMIYRCAHVLKDMKISLVSVLRKMPFSADADWDVVLSRTRIKKLFLKSYESKKIIMQSLPNNPDFLEKEIRRDSIRLLLRSQRHYLGDQFEQGLVSSHTAKMLTLSIMHSYTNKCMMRATNVLKMMAPSTFLLTLHEDLAEGLSRRGTCVRNRILWIFMALNLSFNILRVLEIVFPYSYSFRLWFTLIWIYNICFTLAIAIYLCNVMIKKQKNSWHLLLFITLMLSTWETVSDVFMHQMLWPKYRITGRVLKFIDADHQAFMTLYIGLSALSLCSRVMSIAYCLPVVKKCLARVVHSLLAKSTYIQCEAGFSFMHITKDSMHQLPDSVLDVHVMRSIQLILHQENLSTRQQIGLLEILSPEVLTALKTYIASKLVLNSQLGTVAKLRDEGFLEDLDIEQLYDVIQEKKKRMKHFPATMQVPSLNQLLENLPSFKGYRGKVGYLKRYGQVMTFKPGDEILRQGHDPLGVFVVLKGLVRAECSTIPSMHSDVQPLIPVYHTCHNEVCTQSEQKVELLNFYSTGCILGERTVLTEKPGHKTIRCVTRVRVLFLNNGIIHNLMYGRPRFDEPMSHLEKNMWTCMAIRNAARLIQGKVSSDDLLTCRNVYHMLEHSYLMFGDPGSIIRLNVRQHKAVVLIHGSVRAADGTYHQDGPCFIPHRVSHQDLMVGYGQRSVLLVLPAVHQGEQEEREWSFLRQRDGVSLRDIDDFDEMTASSNSSDGIPHKRYRDTLSHSPNK